jgi:predicted nucleic acid-binding protein
MKHYVLDSFALIAYAENEKGAEEVAEILINALENKAEVYLSVINFGEMYYIAYREGGVQRAEKYRELISKFPLTVINADMEQTLIAARYKAKYKLSYADAFAAGLSEYKKATLVTGDKEFKQLDEIIKIQFI